MVCANCSLVELLQLAIIHSMPCVVSAGVPMTEYTHIDLLVPVPLEQVVQDPCLMQITQLNLKGWKVAPQSLLHPPPFIRTHTSRSTNHVLHALHTGGVHHFDSLGVPRVHPVLPPLVVHQL